jgi:hypothetical protein
MLAVRRAGVTEAIHVLEKQSLIEAHRAEITILNRKASRRSRGASMVCQKRSIAAFSREVYVLT